MGWQPTDSAQPLAHALKGLCGCLRGSQERSGPMGPGRGERRSQGRTEPLAGLEEPWPAVRAHSRARARLTRARTHAQSRHTTAVVCTCQANKPLRWSAKAQPQPPHHHCQRQCGVHPCAHAAACACTYAHASRASRACHARICAHRARVCVHVRTRRRAHAWNVLTYIQPQGRLYL